MGAFVLAMLECLESCDWYFKELAVMFEGSSASGAKRAYRWAVGHLTVRLVRAVVIYAVRVKRASIDRVRKRIIAAVYEHQADCDGKWGGIQFDFETDTAKIMQLAD